MRLLGVILAGGASLRFGSDKALVEIGGEPIIARIAAQLASQCDDVAVAGRAWPGLESIADMPRPGLGPLGGLAAALAHAVASGFDEVLTSGCDLPDLPPALAALLSPADAVIAGQPLLGRWRSTSAPSLLRHLEAGGSRSMYGWITASKARAVAVDHPIANLNTPEDLARYRQPGSG